MTPRHRDRSTGFFMEPNRWWALVYDRNLQSTHCAEATPLLTAVAPASLRRNLVARLQLLTTLTD